MKVQTVSGRIVVSFLLASAELLRGEPSARIYGDIAVFQEEARHLVGGSELVGFGEGFLHLGERARGDGDRVMRLKPLCFGERHFRFLRA